jgi:hypothetical protein
VTKPMYPITEWARASLPALQARLGWTTEKLADLVIASETDFVVPPCPDLCAYYRGDREGMIEYVRAALGGKHRGKHGDSEPNDVG